MEFKGFVYETEIWHPVAGPMSGSGLLGNSTHIIDFKLGRRFQ